jgi:hypothetical protein
LSFLHNTDFNYYLFVVQMAYLLDFLSKISCLLLPCLFKNAFSDTCYIAWKCKNVHKWQNWNNKEAAVTYFIILIEHFPERIEEIGENMPGQPTFCQNSKLGPPECWALDSDVHAVPPAASCLLQPWPRERRGHFLDALSARSTSEWVNNTALSFDQFVCPPATGKRKM